MAEDPGWLRHPDRARLLRWSGWYALCIIGLSWVVGLRYLTNYPWPGDGIARVYTVVSFIGHFFLIGAVPWLGLFAPLTLLVPRRMLVMPCVVTVYAGLLAFLLVDSLVFAQNHFHVDMLTATILGRSTLIFAGFSFVVSLAFGVLLARLIWSRLVGPGRAAPALALAGALGLCLAASFGLHIWADAIYYAPITRFTHYLPWFRPVTATSVLADMGWLDIAASRERNLARRLSADRSGVLRYPLEPLRCRAPEERLNVLLIMVDGLRADTMNGEFTPHIAALADESVRFDNHWSGGNGSRTGTFSVFYALPSTYWETFSGMGRPPVLMDAFLEHYDVEILSAGSLHRPTGLDRTAFSHVPDLRLEAPGAGWERDVRITDDWIAWLDGWTRERPFFGFVFYDASFFPPNHQPVFKAPPGATREQEKLAHYRTARHFVDGQVARVLADLERRGLREHTVLLLTSDHGNEFDDSGMGFTHHGTAYNRYQLQVPMLVRWPGREPAVVTRRTSHNDLAPTLLSDVFGCENPPSDYSSGSNLFGGDAWNWIVAGSYSEFAIVEPNQVIIRQPSGIIEVRGEDYQLVDSADLDMDVISEALRETTRFFAR